MQYLEKKTALLRKYICRSRYVPTDITNLIIGYYGIQSPYFQNFNSDIWNPLILELNIDWSEIETMFLANDEYMKSPQCKGFVGSLHAQIATRLFNKTDNKNVKSKIIGIYETVKMPGSDDSAILSCLCRNL
jgi:hypothetical protein